MKEFDKQYQDFPELETTPVLVRVDDKGKEELDDEVFKDVSLGTPRKSLLLDNV